MERLTRQAREAPQAGKVLTAATLRASELLGGKDAWLARVLGISAASLSRLRMGRTIDPASKEGELAILFVRLFRSLDALVGGDPEKVRAWMWAENVHLAETPARLIESVAGLVHVTEYLDAMRGKV